MSRQNWIGTEPNNSDPAVMEIRPGMGAGWNYPEMLATRSRYISKYIYIFVFRLLMGDRSSEKPLTRNSNVGRTAAKVTFSGYDLEAMLRAQLQSIFLPSVKVARRADVAGEVGTGMPQRTTDTPERFEGLGAVDRRLVDTGESDNIVPAAVAGDSPFPHPSRAGVVRAERVHDVVLDEGVTSPTIDGEAASPVGHVTS